MLLKQVSLINFKRTVIIFSCFVSKFSSVLFVSRIIYIFSVFISYVSSLRAFKDHRIVVYDFRSWQMLYEISLQRFQLLHPDVGASITPVTIVILIQSIAVYSLFQCLLCVCHYFLHIPHPFALPSISLVDYQVWSTSVGTLGQYESCFFWAHPCPFRCPISYFTWGFRSIGSVTNTRIKVSSYHCCLWFGLEKWFRRILQKVSTRLSTCSDVGAYVWRNFTFVFALCMYTVFQYLLCLIVIVVIHIPHSFT